MSKRNFNQLTEREKEIVKTHFDQCMGDNDMNCRLEHNTIEEFWDAHKEVDYPEWQ